ncbi:hypothetical protein PHET_11755 [Paragonimus heterotremus]|uniref:AP180 N-terminal homology (ANTH) domain-containing protein n=1 Tax=Paragonimus heterotremus TaxID=100268 RepID=A0A8J4T0W7_9TREM|nr:hypothetical protein PHET_11755 [Paragonimus heterotremus]
MDALEDILSFGLTIVDSFSQVRSKIFTAAGQCKMAPVLLCLQDAAAIYELIVHFLFRLHDLLGNDTMFGHRARFTSLHNSLKSFFEQAAHVQYFHSLVQIPALSQVVSQVSGCVWWALVAANITIDLNWGSNRTLKQNMACLGEVKWIWLYVLPGFRLRDSETLLLVRKVHSNDK